ncbi:MAG TPA: HAD hydrolase-like protein [bacterium]|nr:HAD hydrolase-like protein [bacterium]HPN30727.1 HAD hydrolase-like protein [bacterium]
MNRQNLINKFKIFCFDFDGVIVESSLIKTEAYKDLFFKYFPEKIDAIIKYHLENSGVVRYKKIKDICENIIKIEYTEELEKKLVEEYELEIFKKVVECEYVAGVIDFLDYLKSTGRKIFVVSGTPDIELKKIIETRKISGYFSEIFGGGREKDYWINHILSITNSRPEELIFIGDGFNDYEAAEKTGVEFIFRITGENNHLLEKIKCLQIIENYSNFIK